MHFLSIYNAFKRLQEGKSHSMLSALYLPNEEVEYSLQTYLQALYEEEQQANSGPPSKNRGGPPSKDRKKMKSHRTRKMGNNEK